MILKYEKAKNYTGGNLEGNWIVTYKIDGIRALVTKNSVFSRNGKPLYNLDHLKMFAPFDAEIYCGSWEKTVSAVKTHNGAYVDMQFVYSLDPLDDRLYFKNVIDPTEFEIKALLKHAQSMQYEGLVLRQGNTWIKVKGQETYDVEIRGIVEGTGKYKGMLGAFITSKGKVGTGFSDEERKLFFDQVLIGAIVEVECQKLTPDGKFRHPRFKRMRFDK